MEPKESLKGGDKMFAHCAMFYFHVWLYVAVVNADYMLKTMRNIYELQRALMEGRPYNEYLSTETYCEGEV